MPCPVEVVLERFEEMAKATGQPSWFVRAKDWRRRAVRTGMRKL
jgi:hypothetical protein